MSMPIFFWLATATSTASLITASNSSSDTAAPCSMASTTSDTISLRGKLPTCVVAIRSALSMVNGNHHSCDRRTRVEQVGAP